MTPPLHPSAALVRKAQSHRDACRLLVAAAKQVAMPGADYSDSASTVTAAALLDAAIRADEAGDEVAWSSAASAWEAALYAKSAADGALRAAEATLADAKAVAARTAPPPAPPLSAHDDSAEGDEVQAA